jgi:hypothetical protein
MKRASRILAAFLLHCFAQYAATQQHASLLGPEDIACRQTILVLAYTLRWWVIRWSDNNILCLVFIDHEGLPTSAE